LTLDAANQINLDAGNAEIHLKHAGTTFGKLFTSGNDFYINHPVADEKIIFSGLDGSSSVTALSLNMADNGAATFSDTVTANAGILVDTTVIDSYIIRQNTSDGSDNSQLSLAGGGADSDGRGARARLYGNEHGSKAGDVDISTGNVANSQMDLFSTGNTTFDSGGTITIDADTQGSGNGILLKDGGSLYGSIFRSSSHLHLKAETQDKNLLFLTNNGGAELTAMTITSNGSVGVGVTPNSGWSASATGGRVPLQVGGFGSISGRLNDLHTEFNNNCYATGTGNDPTWAGLTRWAKNQIELDSAGQIIFKNSPIASESAHNSDPSFTWNERMVVQLDGTILMGKSTAGLGTAGHQFGSDGYLYHTRSGDIMFLNRLSADGTVLTVMKDGSDVGRIGTYGGTTYFVGNSHGLMMNGTAIEPTNNSGGRVDNAVDLGSSNYSFRDAYVSDDVLIGSPSGTNNISSSGLVIDGGSVGSNALNGVLSMRGSGGDFYAENWTTSQANTDGPGFGRLAAFSPGTDYLVMQYRTGGSSSNVMFQYANGNVTVVGTMSDSSDRKLKKNIKDLPSGQLEKVKQLKPVSYTRKSNNNEEIGFIAQDVEELYKEFVNTEEHPTGEMDKDGKIINEDIKVLAYGRLTAVLTKAIQEQQVIIDDLKSRIEALEG